MMNIAQVGGAENFDPSVLSDLGAPESVGWKWQSPRPFAPQIADEAAPLPSWLTDPPPVEAVERPKNIGKEENTEVAEKDADFEEQSMKGWRKNPLANPAVWENFQRCKDIESLYNWAASHDIDVRMYPKLLFARLCHAGQPFPVLLQALEDAALDNTSNLNFLLDWLLRKQKGDRHRLQKRLNPDDIALLQQWMKRQLHLGLRSEEDILVFVRFISRLKDSSVDESLGSNLVASFEGLQSSSVFTIKDLGTEAQCKILELITRGSVTSQLLKLGFSLVEAVPYLQLEGTDRKISAFIGRIIGAQATRHERQKQGTRFSDLLPTIFEKIGALPPDRAHRATYITTKALFDDQLLVPATEAAITQLRDSWLSALATRRGFCQRNIRNTKIEKLLGAQKPQLAVPYLRELSDREKASFMLRYWVGPRSQKGQSRAQYLFGEFCAGKNKESPWVSMLQAARQCAEESLQPLDVNIRQVFKTLQTLRQSETIVEILKQARKLDALIDESDVVYTIKEHLEEQPHLAERMFHFYPKLLRLQNCPELAERIVQNPRTHPTTALRYMRRHASRFRIHREVNGRDPFLQPRIELLGRMALAYSMAPHVSANMAYRSIYECYTQHMKERLGPLSAEMVRGFTQAGLIRPLQKGEGVSSARVRWILSLIRATEGPEVADRVNDVVDKLHRANISSSFAG